ncbi:hypothetical protein CLOM_g18328 [Closterium sp. NIES-68]|nr:hypothetical protein CLOM_g18328 [Closterium sp. NIES-68]
MGQVASREEQLRHAAKHGGTAAIQELVSRGVNVNCVDARGRTPLIAACSRVEGYESAKLLLQMGAAVRVYCKGPGGGTAIHYAARKLLDATVKLLLDHGADPLLPNDDGRTALDLARERNATAVVRLIESRVALFEGYVRQQTLSAPSIVKAFIPQWVYRRVWVAVVPGPTTSDSRQTFRLTLYPSMAFGSPYFDIALHVCRIYMTKMDSANPVLVIEDPIHEEKGKWKFVRDTEAPDPSQIFRLHDACRGMARPGTHLTNQHSTSQHHTPSLHAPPPQAPAAQRTVSRSHTAPSYTPQPPPPPQTHPMYPQPPPPPSATYSAAWSPYYNQQQAQQQQQAWQQAQQHQQQQACQQAQQQQQAWQQAQQQQQQQACQQAQQQQQAWQQQQQQGGLGAAGTGSVAAGAGQGCQQAGADSSGPVNLHAWQADVDEDTAFQLALSESMHSASTADSGRAAASSAAAAISQGIGREEDGADGFILTRSSSEPQSRSGRSLSSSSSTATDAVAASHRSSRSVSETADRHPFAPPAATSSSSAAAGTSLAPGTARAAPVPQGDAVPRAAAVPPPGASGSGAVGVDGPGVREDILNQFSSVAPAINRAAAAVSSLFASGSPSAPLVDAPSTTAAPLYSTSARASGRDPGPAPAAAAAPAFPARAAVAAEAIATAAGAFTSATAAAAATAWQRTTGHRAPFFDPPLIQFSPPSSPRLNPHISPNPPLNPEVQPPSGRPHTPATYVSPGPASVAELHPSYNPDRVRTELARAQSSRGRGVVGASGAAGGAEAGAGARAGAIAGAGAGAEQPQRQQEGGLERVSV